MTPKPPSVDLGEAERDALRDGLGEPTHGASGDESGSPSAAETGAQADSIPETKDPGLPQDEADDSLQAILLQASAKAVDVPAPKPLGSKTLMGIGIEGLSLPAIAQAAIKTKSRVESPGTDDSAADVIVDDLVDAETNDATRRPVEMSTTPGPEQRQVTSLLDEVAQALNVQASEFRDRARGKLPGMPSAANPSSGGGRGGATPGMRTPGQNQAEFEDPTEGPTALTPGVITVGDVAVDADHESDVDSDEEAVVLGHPPIGGSHAQAPSETVEIRSQAGAYIPGSSASGGLAAADPPRPGVYYRPSTPGGGLPPPPSGHVRLPTPPQGQHGPSIPTPALGVDRLTLPLETASPMDSDLTATSPSTPISIEASRRLAADMGMGSRVVVSALSSPGTGRRTSRITQRVVILTSGLPAILTAHVKLATVSLAGLIALTFAGGLFVGMLVWRGQSRAEPPAAAHVVTSAPAAPVPATAPEAPKPPVVSKAPIAPIPTAAAVPPTTAAPPAATSAGTQPGTGAAPHAATASELPAHAASAPAAIRPSPTTHTRAPGAEPSVRVQAAKTAAAHVPPSESAEAALSAKPINRPTPVPASHAPIRPRHPTVGTTASESPPPPAPKLAAPKPAAPAKPATHPATAAATAPASKPVAVAKPAVAKPKTKPVWRDPFAE